MNGPEDLIGIEFFFRRTELLVTFLVVLLGLAFGNLKIKGVGFGASGVLIVAMAAGYLYQFEPIVILQDLGIAGINTVVIIVLSGIPVGIGLGLFAGSFTSSPALISALQFSPGDEVIFGYGIGYPFGLIGVILFITLATTLLKNKMEEEVKSRTKLYSGVFKVVNTELNGKLIRNIELFQARDVVISGILRDLSVRTASGSTPLLTGDVVRLEGKQEAVEEVGNEIGEPIYEDFAKESELDTRSIVVAVGTAYQLDQLELFLGHEHHTVQPRVDIASLAATLFLAFAIGGVVIPIPQLGPFSLGLAGGALVSGLIFGHFGRIGNFIGRFPRNATAVLKISVSEFFGLSSCAHFNYRCCASHASGHCYASRLVVSSRAARMSSGPREGNSPESVPQTSRLPNIQEYRTR